MSERLFLSCASAEFAHVREQFTSDFQRRNVDVKAHEEVANFNSGLTTLEKLDDYISGCKAVVHLLGHAAGTQVEPAEVTALIARHSDLRERLPQIAPLLAGDSAWRGSYTQWEAYLALYHRKRCFVYRVLGGFERPQGFKATAVEGQLQDEHYHRLEGQGRDRGDFVSREELRIAMQRSLGDLLPPDFPFKVDVSRIFKYAPAELIGREEELKRLNNAWHGRAELLLGQDEAQHRRSTKPKILTFVALGGEGKTSLVAKWVAELATQEWPGCDGAFAWSFYSQGTREQLTASSDLFLNEALTFFGDDADKALAASPAGALEKGQRLACLVGQRRSLLILDGLEPLQYAPASPTPGQLEDQGVAALLKGLAAASHGLCVVTTRYSLPDLKAFWQTTAPEVKLARLSHDAGVHLLKTLGVRGTAKEFEALVEDVKGHALTLTLLGGFLKRAFQGDIRQRDCVKFEKADEQMDGGHAFRTMAAYEKWLLRDGGDEGRREVAVLRLMGLFDRPADAGCLAALRRETIPGLTEPLAGLADDDWEFCLSGLEGANLLTVNREASGTLVSLDAHPHLREYFARQIRAQQPDDAWRAAHRRLYEHLCVTAPECTKFDESDVMRQRRRIPSDKPRPKLEDLQPLYQAVAHGCQARLHSEVLLNVFDRRIYRSDAKHSIHELAAFGSNLSAIGCFFDQPWNQTASTLDEEARAWVVSEAAVNLKALGRLREAKEPMQAGLDLAVNQQRWQDAVRRAGNLSELELILGNIAAAEVAARSGMDYALRCRLHHELFTIPTFLADVLHHAGKRDDATRHFKEAERLQARFFPQETPLLYSIQGLRFCDLLLGVDERNAWRQQIRDAGVGGSSELGDGRNGGTSRSELYACRQAVNRAKLTIEIGLKNRWFIDIALGHLTYGRAELYASLLTNAAESRQSRIDAKLYVKAASERLKSIGDSSYLPLALLTRAWLRFLIGARTGLKSAQEDLDEAWEIAERGPMKLFLADIHLHRARLFFREKEYPKAWISPQADLAAAEKLIKDCGYHRRDEELADAKRAILGS